MRNYLLVLGLFAAFTASEAMGQTGACCLIVEGTCTDGLTAEACTEANGVYQGDGTLCSETTCPTMGACCGILTAGCTDGTTQSECENSIFGTYQGDHTLCEDCECPPEGACCREADGVCMRTTTEMMCEFYWHNTWLGEGTTCSGENPCPQPPRGACCMQDGSCLDEQLPDDCTYYEGVYQGDYTLCADTTCPQPAIGACCFPSGGCLVIAEYLCEDNNGTFHGDGTDCWPHPCDSGAPPTLGWTDDFESYAAGTFLNHVGGWWGWDDTAAAAASVTDAYAHSGTNALIANDTVDAVHPFTPSFSGGQWIITAWQYIPTGFSGTTYFVVNSYYEDGGTKYWSLELHFDSTMGKVYDSQRDSTGAQGLPLIYDQWVEVRIEVDFDAGSVGTITTYYDGAQVFSGDYITGGIGQLAIANIDIYAPHATPVYYDDLSVEPDVGSVPSNPTRPLFVGRDIGDADYVKGTDLSNFPDVTWYPNGWQFEVEGAAGMPDGNLWISSGENFSTTSGELYKSALEGPPIFWVDTDNYLSGLAYGKGRLFAFCNYASPKGIYEVNTDTGETTLLIETGGSLYFALDYNPVDGLLYGYNEYASPTGLDSLNIETGEILHVVDKVPSDNSACRGLACGNNKVYAMTVYGEDYPMYVYDLAQGTAGTWVPMAHPFTEGHSGGGAAWIPGVVAGDMNCDGSLDTADIEKFVQALLDPDAYTSENLDCIIWNADINEDDAQDGLDIAGFVELLLDQ